MDDPHHLARFVAAQADVWPAPLDELRRGRKQSHWMWFVFPQLAGLGMSAMSQHYAIRSREEAEAYLGHELLGSRLGETTDAVIEHAGRLTAEAIFGGIDAIKFRSSMTLFDAVAPDDRYRRALDAFYSGAPDPATLRLLA
ncbi:MAG: DUF1810 domain-containing protein [Allosphingosinicella sp.]|uniref:DUF1810 domain-containing protein n=1 Tax=Allosphingosinicella sp. TaxID=2823234 RepID=UPI00394E5CF6